MKSVLKIIILVVLCIPNLYAQKQLDSLQNELQQTTVDTLKIALLQKIMVQYRRSSAEQHFKYISQGLTLSEKLARPQNQGIFFKELGLYYKNKGNLDSALFYYEKSRTLFLSIQDSINFHGVSYSMGNLKKAQGSYENAIQFFVDGIAFYEKRKSPRMQLNAIVGKINLGALYTSIKEYEKGITIYRQVLNDSLSYKNKSIVNAAYTNLSASYTKIKKLDSALFYAEKSEKFLKGSNRKSSLANTYINIGALHEQNNDFTKAKAYFTKALQLFEALKKPSGIIKSHNNIGNVFTKLGNFTQAEYHLLKANALLQSTKNSYSLEHNYSMLSELYVQSNRFEKAFEVSKKLHRLKDSILGLEQQKAVSEIEVKYEVEKNELRTKNALKEKEIAQINAATNKNYLFYGITIAGLILVSLSLYIIFFKAKKKQQIIALELHQANKKLELEKLYRNSELKALKAQMNPHFMFNAMNSIQSLILKGDRDEAYSYLTKFAALIRENLNMSEKNFVYFDQELQLLDTYLQLEELRFSADFTYEILGAENIEDIKIPAMIIQPFVENAIKHGLMHSTGAKKLIIRFEQSTLLTCIVEDNGIGRKASEELKSKHTSHKSFATSAIAKRFELFKEYYKMDLGFVYEDILNDTTVEGTRVIIKIPFLDE
ncbi:tetratricopeptide repeat-containing sensor histidine kinase [Kordia sp.]|uniref:tetratricopeptide repeat-containing sensor histidine kinase n=1 Tax=Kordia sp. TaxID=1965332 RepID=UPI003D2D4523